MLPSVRTRTCVVLLLLLSLLATPLLARPAERSAPVKQERVLVQLWHVLGRLVPVFGQSMGTMDPNGAPTSATDSRGTMDPGGASTSADSMGTMDPDGR